MAKKPKAPEPENTLRCDGCGYFTREHQAVAPPFEPDSQPPEVTANERYSGVAWTQ